MVTPARYKWLVLVATCLCTFCGFGYIVSTTSTGTIYYTKRYDERVISGIIGPAQISCMQVTGLPWLFLTRKVGNRIVHLVGSVLMVAAICLTSLTTTSWQGLLLSGVCAGTAGGMMHVSTTKVIQAYFPGRQIAPFGAVCFTINVASMIFPQVWEQLMTALGWQNGLLIIGGILSVNFFCGLSYAPPAKPDDGEKSILEAISTPETPSRKISLLFQSRSSNFQLDSLPTADQTLNRAAEDLEKKLGAENEAYEDSESSDGKNNPSENNNIDDDNSANKSDNVNVDEKFNESTKENISLWKTLKRPQSVALIFMSCTYSGALTTCATVMGDYATLSLGMTEAEIANALTIMGAMQIVASCFYMFLTACTDFSATVLHFSCMLIFAPAVLAMCFITNGVQFIIVVGAIGFAKAITSGNSAPLAMELTNPEEMMNLFVLKLLADGVGSLGISFIAIYIQETVNNRAALFMSFAAFCCSGATFIPLLKKYMHRHKHAYTNELPSDDILAIGFRDI